MNLKEYADVISMLIPIRAAYIVMDEAAIKIYREKPVLENKTARRLQWQGSGCIAVIRYWDDFLDISEWKYDDGEIDWYLAIEPMKDAKGWAHESSLEVWSHLLDQVIPLEFSFATLSHGILELWKRRPSWDGQKWNGAGGQKPIAMFSAPPSLISTEKGASEGPEAIAELK